MRNIVILGTVLVIGTSFAQNPDSAWLSADSSGYPVLEFLEVEACDTVAVHLWLKNASDSAHAVIFPLCWPDDFFDLTGAMIDSSSFPECFICWNISLRDTLIGGIEMFMLYGYTAVYPYGIPPGLTHLGSIVLQAIPGSGPERDSLWASDTSYVDTCFYPPGGHLMYTNAPHTTDYWPEWTPVEVVRGYWYGWPDIDVYPDTLRVEFERDTVLCDSFFVLNVGHSVLFVDSIVCDTSWLSVAPDDFIILPGDTQTVEVQLSPYGLDHGQHRSSVIVCSNDPDESSCDVVVALDVAIKEGTDTPEPRTGLRMTSLNPFSGEVELRYDIAKDGPVDASIYDMTGRTAVSLFEGVQPAGSYTIVWDGRDAHGHRLPSGIYFIRLEAGEFSVHRKMVLLR